MSPITSVGYEQQSPARIDYSIEHQVCPECRRVIAWLIVTKYNTRADGKSLVSISKDETLIIPKASGRKPVPSTVPAQYASDYNEACLVLSDSPKASAALGRRCLQSIIHDVAKLKRANLFDEIEALISSGALPSFLNEQLHAVRVVGNFAAHPMKSTNSGELIDVEPGEAEWTLDVLETLFDFYFVQPEAAKQKKAQINKKLSDAQKPTI